MRKSINPSMSRVDRWLGPALTLLALAWLWLVQTQIPDPAAEWPGPRGFPWLLGIVLAVLGLWMALTALAGPHPPSPGLRRTTEASGEGGRRTRPTYDPGSRIPDPGSRRREVGVAGGTFGVLVLYAFLLQRVGFLLATPVVIALTMRGVLRMRAWIPILSLAVAFTLGCWLVFQALLGTPLPRGSWIGW
jgi:hypothetical protein